MVHRLLYPATVQGRGLHFALVAYLSISIIGCTAPQKSVKPPADYRESDGNTEFCKGYDHSSESSNKCVAGYGLYH